MESHYVTLNDAEDVAARLLDAYCNMGTASREDLKEAADTIISLRLQISRMTALMEYRESSPI
jgi:hypothetical protein